MVALVSGTDTLRLPACEWLVDSLIPAEGLALVYAPPASGKSLWALSMGLSVASGTPFLGRTVASGPVVYIVAEGIGDISSRVAAWSLHHGIAPSPQFHLLPEAIDLPTSADSLVTQLEGIGPVLVVADTLARTSTSISENSTSGMGQLVAACGLVQTRLGASVLLVHHSGKGDPSEERGSGALRGACDSVVLLQRDGATITETHSKSKYGRELEPLTLAMVPVAGSVTIDLAPTPDLTLDLFYGLLALDDSRTLAQWRREYSTRNAGADFATVARGLLADGWAEKWQGLYSRSPRAVDYFRSLAPAR